MPKDTAPGPGHNSELEMSEEDFLRFVADHEDIDAKIEALKVERGRLRKRAKAGGIKLKQFDDARRDADMSRADVQDKFLHHTTYLKWLRAPIGTQFELHLDPIIDDDESEEADEAIIERAVQDATAEGFFAGLRNADPATNPHEGNSAAGQAWIKSHHDGLNRRNHELTVDPLTDEDDDD